MPKFRVYTDEELASPKHQNRLWRWTWNNPGDANPALLLEGKCKYAIWSLEKGEKTGTEHFQGFVCFDNTVRATQVRAMLPGCRIFGCSKGEKNNINYCTKSATHIAGPWSVGIVPQVKAKGEYKKRDFKELKEDIASGMTKEQLIEKHFDLYLKYHGAIDKMLAARTGHHKRSEPPRVVVVYGPSGTGKSRWAREQCQGDIYDKPPNTYWWTHYEGQPNIIIDDFKGGFSFTEFKTWTDRYPVQVRVHNSQVWLGNAQMIFTTNKVPWEWYNFFKEGNELTALTRRVTQWVYFYEFSKYEVFTDFQEFKSSVERNKILFR